MRQRELTVAIRHALFKAPMFVPGWTESDVQRVALFRYGVDLAD